MPSRICCPNNHTIKGVSIHDAAVALSEERAVGVCETCGKELQLRIDQVHANARSRRYVVTRAVRLGTRRSGGENYDPFLLVLRDIKTDTEQILPTFWRFGKSKIPRGGQFPPLLSLAEWKALFLRLDASVSELEQRIRVRAYELYERRGRCDGHDLEDWLQAEAELRGQKALRAAA